MSAQLTKDLTAAHLNGLKSSIHALEVQITILKTLVGTEGASDDAEDEEVEEKPAKKTRGKKAAASFDDADSDEELSSDDAPDAEESEDDDFSETPKKTRGKKAAADFGDEEESEEVEEKPAKKSAAKKITLADVNEACKGHCGRHNRAMTIALLKKQFKVDSVSKLKPEQYPEVIKALSK